MTKSEALKILYSIRLGYWKETNAYKAMSMAISALEAQDVPDINVGDMISRKAAIDALNSIKIYRQLDSDRYVISDCLNKIVNLPSAQPELAQDLHNACIDSISRQAAIDVTDRETVSTNPDDFIYHEKFIDFMNDDEVSSFGEWQWSNGFNTALVAVKIGLEKLPSAQPEYRLDEWCTDCKEYDAEKHCCPRFNQVIRTTLDEMEPARKKGKWKLLKNGSAICSECGFTQMNAWDLDNWDNFCRHCGADMRQEDNNECSK